MAKYPALGSWRMPCMGQIPGYAGCWKPGMSLMCSPCDRTMCCASRPPQGWSKPDPAQLADELPPEAWAAHPAGEGSKGLRLYEWARIALHWKVDERFERWLLIRRSRQDGQDCASYLVFA